MAYDFPASPSIGQVYQNWTWDGEKWVSMAVAPIGAVRYDLPQGLSLNQMAQARSNIAVTKKNYVINGAFMIQQDTTYVSNAVLAAGAYGHDQWKAGAAGGDYTFTQLKSSTTITIKAGKSLIQPIEDIRVDGGDCVLAWTGTAQARAGVNTLTPSGSYAASPLIITGQTAGTVMSVEFNAGTLGNVSLTEGTVAPPFQVPDYASELLLCQRYYEKAGMTVGVLPANTFNNTTWFKAQKRAVPTITLISGTLGTATVVAMAPAQLDGMQQNTSTASAANVIFSVSARL